MPGPAAAAPPFGWVGGSPALDFTNTVSWTTPERTEERLRSYADLIRWAAAAGLLTPPEARALARRAADQQEKARRTFARALELRDALHDVFIAQADGVEPGSVVRDRLNRFLAPAVGHLRLGGGGRAGWSWGWLGWAELESPLWLVAWSAGQLLTSDGLRLLKRCANDQCGWLFLDRSRNHARRWCDMRVCGNNEKARRFYRRRAARPTG